LTIAPGAIIPITFQIETVDFGAEQRSCKGLWNFIFCVTCLWLLVSTKTRNIWVCRLPFKLYRVTFCNLFCETMLQLRIKLRFLQWIYWILLQLMLILRVANFRHQPQSLVQEHRFQYYTPKFESFHNLNSLNNVRFWNMLTSTVSGNSP
jgi:hypothetical protein